MIEGEQRCSNGRSKVWRTRELKQPHVQVFIDDEVTANEHELWERRAHDTRSRCIQQRSGSEGDAPLHGGLELFSYPFGGVIWTCPVEVSGQLFEGPASVRVGEIRMCDLQGGVGDVSEEVVEVSTVGVVGNGEQSAVAAMVEHQWSIRPLHKQEVHSNVELTTIDEQRMPNVLLNDLPAAIKRMLSARCRWSCDGCGGGLVLQLFLLLLLHLLSAARSIIVHLLSQPRQSIEQEDAFSTSPCRWFDNVDGLVVVVAVVQLLTVVLIIKQPRVWCHRPLQTDLITPLCELLQRQALLVVAQRLPQMVFQGETAFAAKVRERTRQPTNQLWPRRTMDALRMQHVLRGRSVEYQC